MIEEQVIEWVNQIASLFGELAPEVWRILVTQAYVEGAQSVVLAIASLVIMWRVGKGVRWAWLEEDGSGDGIGMMMILGIVWLVGGVIATVAISKSLGYFINPEYYALMDILRPVMGGGQ